VAAQRDAEGVPPLSVDCQIEMFFHCALCLEEFKKRVPAAVGQSPATYARLNAGFTPRGLQVWCERHQCNVCNIDFEGCQHPALLDRKPDA